MALSVDQWIAMATSAGTFIAASLAFFSVRELAKQREESVRPHFGFRSRYFSVFIPNAIGTWVPGHVEVDDGTYQAANLEFVNFGRGAAKDISVVWQLEWHPLLDRINAVSLRNFSNVSLEADNHYLKVSTSEGVQGAFSIDSRAARRQDFCLPISQGGNPLAITMPPVLQVLTAAYFYVSKWEDISHNASRFFEDWLKDISVILEYTDVNNKRYFSQHNLQIRIDMIQSKPLRLGVSVTQNADQRVPIAYRHFVRALEGAAVQLIRSLARSFPL